MADDQLIVAARRVAGELRELKASLRKKYPKPSQQVVSPALRKRISATAETWLTDLSQRTAASISAEYLADLNVHFQRLLVWAERATVRRRYDQEIGSVLRTYTTDLVVPLMQAGAKNRPLAPVGNGEAARVVPADRADAEGFRPFAFVGHSFAPKDRPIVKSVTDGLEAIGIRVVTGQKPQADKISAKVKQLIEGQHLFVGIFTRRDKLVGKDEWSTSAWVIDEKAYAYGRNKKLILLKEAGVESIGGIQGDYEFIEFSRDTFQDAIIALVQLFKCAVTGLR